jgi:hypothetical protein
MEPSFAEQWEKAAALAPSAVAVPPQAVPSKKRFRASRAVRSPTPVAASPKSVPPPPQPMVPPPAPVMSSPVATKPPPVPAVPPPIATTPSVEERNRLARQYEQALLNDDDDDPTSDPVQTFVDSLRSPPRSPRTANPVTPSTPSSVTPTAPAKISDIFDNPVFRKERSLAQQLEDALLTDDTDETFDPIQFFLQAINPAEGTPALPNPPIAKTSPPPVQDNPVRSSTANENTMSTNDRIESFVQNLRQIRNLDSSTLEPRPPTEATQLKSTVPQTVPSRQRPESKQAEEESTVETTASPFYFATPADSKTAQAELKLMESNMLAYLETNGPAENGASEDSWKMAKSFVDSATPIVEKGASMAVSGIGSAWAALYGAAKKAAEQKIDEQTQQKIGEQTQRAVQARAEIRKEATSGIQSTDLPSLKSSGGWKPLQSVWENMFQSFEGPQIDFPFGVREPKVDSIQLPATPLPRQDILVNDLEENTDGYVDPSADIEPDDAVAGEGTQSSMQDLAQAWTSMNRNEALDPNDARLRLGDTSTPPTGGMEEAATATGGEPTLADEAPLHSRNDEVDGSSTPMMEEYRTQSLSEDGGNDNPVEARSSLESLPVTIDANEVKTDASSVESKDDGEIVQAKFRESLASLRQKLASQSNGSLSSGGYVPAGAEKIAENISLEPAIAQPAPTSWQNLANEWKQRNSEVGQDYSVSGSPVSLTIPTSQDTPKEPLVTDLAAEWKQRNRETDYEQDSSSAPSLDGFSSQVDPNYLDEALTKGFANDSKQMNGKAGEDSTAPRSPDDNLTSAAGRENHCYEQLAKEWKVRNGDS